METTIESLGMYWGNIGIMEKKNGDIKLGYKNLARYRLWSACFLRGWRWGAQMGHIKPDTHEVQATNFSKRAAPKELKPSYLNQICSNRRVSLYWYLS